MNKKCKQIFETLINEFPQPKCELNFSNNFQLLVAVILSAQCTDKQVNKTTEKLFIKYADVFSFANANREELEKDIYSCGFYKNKAKNIIAMSKSIIEKFDGQVPNSQSELESLSGVGRKTANVVFSVGFKGDAIAVDTHVFRVSHRLALTKAKTANEVEKDLMKLFDKKIWSQLHYLLVLHGRYVCKAQKPMCEICPLKDLCKEYKKTKLK